LGEGNGRDSRKKERQSATLKYEHLR
jgi:hypothetical protein